MKILCLIPARHKSKRLPNKNFLKIKGKFLIEWTLLLSSKIKDFNEIVLSTDYNKIFKLKKKYPKISFQKRPKRISTDKTKMESVIKYTLLKFKKIGKNFDAIVVLQPTSPLRKIKTIINAIKKFKKYKPDYLASIKSLKHTQAPKMIFEFSNKKLVKKINIDVNKSKKNNKYYSLDGGVIFIFKIPNKKYRLYGKGAFIEVKFPENIDIDYKEDFLLAKKFLK
tara:strand:+ start:72 stop:743 length:672 start_codon:yes stop_codon:yes gene_type:complete